MALIVVTGPPAGGKSTYALQRAQPGDIVVDFDRLAVALTGPGGDPHDHPAAVTAVARAARTAAIDAALKQARIVDVYLIHSSPGRQRMADYRVMGAQVITVDPGRDVVRHSGARRNGQGACSLSSTSGTRSRRAVHPPPRVQCPQAPVTGNSGSREYASHSVTMRSVTRQDQAHSYALQCMIIQSGTSDVSGLV